MSISTGEARRSHLFLPVRPSCIRIEPVSILILFRRQIMLRESWVVENRALRSNRVQLALLEVSTEQPVCEPRLLLVRLSEVSSGDPLARICIGSRFVIERELRGRGSALPGGKRVRASQNRLRIG